MDDLDRRLAVLDGKITAQHTMLAILYEGFFKDDPEERARVRVWARGAMEALYRDRKLTPQEHISLQTSIDLVDSIVGPNEDGDPQHDFG